MNTPFKHLLAIVLLLSMSIASKAEKGIASAILGQKKQVFNITDYGAIGDGLTKSTEAIQNAINECNAAGGGKVWVPKGDYVIAPIQVKSNVTVTLDYGATLLGSQDIKDYTTDHMIPAREGNSECLIYAGNAENIGIEGLGVIDGRGTPEAFPKNAGPDGKNNRPRLLRFENCKNVSFSGISYYRPAFWGIHLIDCHKVHFNGITVNFRNNGANNDGLDIDGCEEVVIENCDINSGDDAICLKSSLKPCKNIVVRNCSLTSHTAPLKFGTSSAGGFINVKVENCYIYDSPMGAIKLQIVDGGVMENIEINRITIENSGSPIFIRLGGRGSSYTYNTYTGTGNDERYSENSERASVGSIKNIRISNIVANVCFQDREEDKKTGYRNIKYKSEAKTKREKAQAGPIMITGIPGHYIENVHLENIKITYPGGGTVEEAAITDVPEDIARYPEQDFFGVLPAWGAYIRHAKNITFKNVTMELREADARKETLLIDVEGFERL